MGRYEIRWTSGESDDFTTRKAMVEFIHVMGYVLINGDVVDGGIKVGEVAFN